MTHLTARRLSMRYGDHPAYAGVDLEVPRGRITTIVGPSGCGKSSFLATLNRLTDLVPGAVASGALHLDGADVLAPGLDVVAHRRRVGMIFQRPNPFPFSIRWNLELPLREHGLPERPARIERALRDVGLWDEVKDRLDRPALALSGGQQQRLCLARALALEPEVVLLDEPCSALDPHAAGVVEDHVASLRGRYTVVLVTHDLGQARRLGDVTAVFGQVDGVGRLLERGATAQVFGAPSDPAVARWLGGRR